MPLPRDGSELRMSRWFQYMVGVIHIDWKPTVEDKALKTDPELTVNVRLGHRDNSTNWTIDAQSTEKRTLSCVKVIYNLYYFYCHSIKFTISSLSKDKDYYECDIIPLYEIGSVHHDFYLLNLQLSNFSKTVNKGLNPEDIYLHVILQTGGFTRVWFSLKTITFPCIISLIIFFWHRIRKLSRPSNLLEKYV